jgi:hypothetical protein
MERKAAIDQLGQFQRIGRTERQTVFGFLYEINSWLADFKAGAVMIEPNPFGEVSDETDFRIWFTSWDGASWREVSDMTDKDFISFLKTQPALLDQAK